MGRHIRHKMLTKTYTGIIEKSFQAYGRHDTIMLKQPDGYSIDLVSRLTEAVYNYGKAVKIVYWTAKSVQSKEAMQEGAIRRMCGAVDVCHKTEEYSYSEYTSDTDYVTEMDIGKHNLYKELCKHTGKFLWLEVEFTNVPEHMLPMIPDDEVLSGIKLNK